ncbi:MAG: PadR family transcriptional regulator, partial [Planctomycetota bacterium]
FLGEFEQMVIAAILRLGDEAYGVSIIDAISEQTGRTVRSGALSVTLDRMERKGLVRSELGDTSEGRAGRQRRYIRVTRNGMELARESREALLNLWQDIEGAYEGP